MENQDYGRFLRVMKKSIRSYQLEAMRAVNRELVALYWEICRRSFRGGMGSLRVSFGMEQEFSHNNKTYEKYLLRQSRFDQALPESLRAPTHPGSKSASTLNCNQP
mgnify:CR=1 FL=1